MSSTINLILAAIGSWFVFGKSGAKRYWALIPIAREYELGVCGDREAEGRVYAVLAIIYELLGLSYFRDNVLKMADEAENGAGIEKSFIVLAYSLCLFIVLIARFIYRMRLFSGLVQIYGKSRKWVWLFAFFEGPTLLLWGLSPRFQPMYQAEEIMDYTTRTADHDAAILSEGLTVNIRERTVRDFLKQKTLLRDIHLNIPPGHMVLLLGGSGAGKTTFVNAVTGYEKADASIELNEQDLYQEYEKLKYEVGFVPQLDLIRGNDTVLSTLNDAAELRLPAEMPKEMKKEKIQRMLETFGLTSVQNSLVEKLSGGQRKRLSIAMEFISEPTLFFLDEPDSGLDGVVARNLFEKLREIADEGRIVIVITHTPDRVIDLFDDVIVLAKDAGRTGRLAWYGPVKEAYGFFGKDSMEDILLSINQKDEGGEGRADEFVEKYVDWQIGKAV